MPLSDLFRRKTAAQAVAESERPEQALKKSLGAFDLTMLGVGAIVGAGIFSAIGGAVVGGPDHPAAGPAVMLSFVLTAIACGFAALCYAEVATLVPVAGSAYTYSYVAFGEIVAWIIGWDLLVEYVIGNVYLAQAWGDYFREFLRQAFHADLPGWLSWDMMTAARSREKVPWAPEIGGLRLAFHLPAVFITILITALLVRGVKESARANTVMVCLKLGLLGLFIAVGLFNLQPSNWTPFAPNGFAGIWVGASLVFFSYIGFDALSTAAEETRDPQRNVPIGMVASLLICTVLYIVVAAVLTGMVPFQELNPGDPLADALAKHGLTGTAIVVSIGAVIAFTAVLLVFQLGQTRIFLAMARDGLLPKSFSRVHPRYRTPHVNTIVTGFILAVGSCVIDQDTSLMLCNIGTLFAFILVSAGVIVLRVREPDRPRGFRVPGYPYTPLISIAACLWLMAGLPVSNWWRFGIWLGAGILVYFAYGYRRSAMAGRAR